MLETKNDERIERLNRVTACSKELQILEGDKNQAIEYLKKERNLLLLTNMLHFCDLSEGVDEVNKCVQKIEEKKTFARTVREEKKKKMEENRDLV
jgi:hypothetical protein